MEKLFQRRRRDGIKRYKGPKEIREELNWAGAE